MSYHCHVLGAFLLSQNPSLGNKMKKKLAIGPEDAHNWVYVLFIPSLARRIWLTSWNISNTLQFSLRKISAIFKSTQNWLFGAASCIEPVSQVLVFTITIRVPDRMRIGPTAYWHLPVPDFLIFANYGHLSSDYLSVITSIYCKVSLWKYLLWVCWDWNIAEP